jgi:hypothetical protein
MGGVWMAWTYNSMAIVGVGQRPQTSKMILVYHFNNQHVLAILNARMMDVTTLNRNNGIQNSTKSEDTTMKAFLVGGSPPTESTL